MANRPASLIRERENASYNCLGSGRIRSARRVLGQFRPGGRRERHDRRYRRGPRQRHRFHGSAGNGAARLISTATHSPGSKPSRRCQRRTDPLFRRRNPGQHAANRLSLCLGVPPPRRCDQAAAGKARRHVRGARPQMCRIISMRQADADGDYAYGSLQLAVAAEIAREFSNELEKARAASMANSSPPRSKARIFRSRSSTPKRGCALAPCFATG